MNFVSRDIQSGKTLFPIGKHTIPILLFAGRGTAERDCSQRQEWLTIPPSFPCRNSALLYFSAKGSFSSKRIRIMRLMYHRIPMMQRQFDSNEENFLFSLFQ